MADDLRERVQRGDFAALADPLFPLQLLAEGPTSEWWIHGSAACTRALLVTLVTQLDARGFRAAVHAWGQKHARASPRMWPSWHEHLKQLNPQAARRSMLGHLLPMIADVQRRARLVCEPPVRPALLVVDLVRHLRSQLPSAPHNLDDALAMLERYGG